MSISELLGLQRTEKEVRWLRCITAGHRLGWTEAFALYGLPFFLKACGVPLHGRSSGQFLPLRRHRVDRQSLPQGQLFRPHGVDAMLFGRLAFFSAASRKAHNLEVSVLMVRCTTSWSPALRCGWDVV